MSGSVSKAVEEQAIEYVCDRRFHRRFVLPRTAAHGPLRISYAVAGIDEPNVPTILFMSGMFGGRLNALDIDYLAKKKGLRVICVDRPGMSGSTPVKIQHRVQVWLETCPALLEHLEIKHVVLLAHSAGAIYLLNTLLHLRDLLSPTKPYVALIAPWVHPAQSQVTALAVAEMIPEVMMRNWNGISKAFDAYIMPMKAFSSGFIGGIMSSWGWGKQPVDDAEERSLIEKYHGVSKEVQNEIDKKCNIYASQEETIGANDEAMLCLKKAGPGLWGACEDHSTFVDNLVASERRRKASGSNTTSNLKVQAYFAESDMLIGERGKLYFEECWSAERTGGVIDFTAITTTKTNHDNVCGAQRGYMEKIFDDAKLSLTG